MDKMDVGSIVWYCLESRKSAQAPGNVGELKSSLGVGDLWAPGKVAGIFSEELSAVAYGGLWRPTWPPSGFTLEKKNRKGMSHTLLISVFLVGYGLLYLNVELLDDRTVSRLRLKSSLVV